MQGPLKTVGVSDQVPSDGTEHAPGRYDAHSRGAPQEDRTDRHTRDAQTMKIDTSREGGPPTQHDSDKRLPFTPGTRASHEGWARWRLLLASDSTQKECPRLRMVLGGIDRAFPASAGAGLGCLLHVIEPGHERCVEQRLHVGSVRFNRLARKRLISVVTRTPSGVSPKSHSWIPVIPAPLPSQRMRE
jgi:hypothetical protein